MDDDKSFEEYWIGFLLGKNYNQLELNSLRKIAKKFFMNGIKYEDLRSSKEYID